MQCITTSDAIASNVQARLETQLALAVKHGARLVTFDRTIPIAAVRGARADHLVVP